MANVMVLRGQTQSFTCMNMYLFCALRRTALLWLSGCSLTLQATPFADEAC